jgi:hypothetical protein
LPRARQEYPRFPNPHVRTTAFAARRTHLQALPFGDVRDKHSAYLLESGHESITRRVLAQDLKALVVGSDGRSYDIPEWPRSGTYRSGEQAKLLVSDNRTRDWERASLRLRRRLTRDAWGTNS